MIRKARCRAGDILRPQLDARAMSVGVDKIQASVLERSPLRCYGLYLNRSSRPSSRDPSRPATMPWVPARGRDDRFCIENSGTGYYFPISRRAAAFNLGPRSQEAPLGRFRSASASCPTLVVRHRVSAARRPQAGTPKAYSISSSACAWTMAGMATPSVSAARVLMISSNLNGRSIGRSAGEPPASTLPTNMPTCLFAACRLGP